MKREYTKQNRTYFQEKFKKNAPQKIIFMIISHIQKTKQTTPKKHREKWVKCPLLHGVTSMEVDKV
jgi:type IV secretory pathway VirD2 relaxase